MQTSWTAVRSRVNTTGKARNSPGGPREHRQTGLKSAVRVDKIPKPARFIRDAVVHNEQSNPTC